MATILITEQFHPRHCFCPTLELNPGVGGVEVRGVSDRSTPALHILRGDGGRHHRSPHGRASHLRIRGSGCHNQQSTRRILSNWKDPLEKKDN